MSGSLVVNSLTSGSQLTEVQLERGLWGRAQSL